MSKHIPGPIKRIINNTDAVDIEARCLGLDVYYAELTPLHTSRGLHIQIRHNSDKATFEEANRVASLLVAAPEMLSTLKQAAETLSNLEATLEVGRAYLKIHDLITRIEGAK